MRIFVFFLLCSQAVATTINMDFPVTRRGVVNNVVLLPLRAAPIDDIIVTLDIKGDFEQTNQNVNVSLEGVLIGGMLQLGEYNLGIALNNIVDDDNWSQTPKRDRYNKFFNPDGVTLVGIIPKEEIMESMLDRRLNFRTQIANSVLNVESGRLNINIQYLPIPEPSSITLIMLGLFLVIITGGYIYSNHKCL